MEKDAYAKRLSHRPGSQPTPRGVLNEDLGSGFDLPKNSQRMVDLDASEDELDSLPKMPASQPTREKRDMDEVIKTMKFRKNKPGADAESGTPTSKENTQRAADRKAARDVTKNAVASASTTRPLGDNATTRNQSPDTRAKRSTELTEMRNGKSVAEPKPERPKPRPLVRPAQTKTPLVPSTSQRKSPSKLRTSPSASSLDGSSPVGGNKLEKKTRPTATAFPMMSPLDNAKGKGKERKETIPAEPERRKGTGKGKEKELPLKMKRAYPGTELSPLSSPTKTPRCFLPSPLGTPNKKKELASTDFPAPSPLRPGGNAKPKLKAFPFPMNSQAFEASPSSKRRSLGSDSDDERDRKRYKNQPVVLAGESYDFEEDSELLFISPGTDPKTLCPYCDTPLPAQPTPLLTRLLEQTFNKSYRDARPSNPLGRKAPMGVFVAVCQRHRFESETLPEAEARGWPKYIDWAGLKHRVLAMKRNLQQILADPGDPIVYGNDDGEEENEAKQKHASQSGRKKGPRMSCVFWKELVKELKTKGSKGVKGVRGQFANFEKTQPGYYGELGSVIIHQTLYDMFPLTAVDPDLVDPLTPNEFIQRILVPEVGMRLVMEDMDLNPDDKSDKKRAVTVLRESASYGVAMFPEDGGDWAGASGKKKDNDGEEAMGVADRMVMERARKRRKELEIEEREEEEMWRLQEEEAEKQKQKAEIAKQKRRARRKVKEKEAEPVAVDPATVVRPRPRPIPKNKGKPVVTVDSTSGMDTDSSSDPRPSRDDSDMDMATTSRSSGARDLGPNPTPRSRRVDKLDIPKLSDSDEFPETIAITVPIQRTKPKTRSARATPASSETEFEGMVNISPRPRSPSASLTSSKRDSSVVDLCSSSEDGGSGVDGASKSRKPRQLEPVISRRKPRKSYDLPDSSDEDETEATPRARGAPTKTGSHYTPIAASSSFRPLDAARRRAPLIKG
ncbi:RTC4-like domain-containing protein [Mycena leptocephala]|nr:RTC4-like domain-containing protein [Mycena leptocephala]